MKKEIEISAKTLELALAKAAEELGASSVEALEYTVVEKDKKGFLGLGARDAKIVASYTKGGVEIAVDFIKTLLDDMSVEASITLVDVDNADKQINIDGKDAGMLIGHHGETMDSLQYLVSLVVNKYSDEYIRVKIDTENYRERRKETLENLARNIAYKVKRTRKTVSLEPMNPYERRVIHSALQNDRYVTTHSEGEEPYRRVVVTLKDNHHHRNYHKKGER